MRRGPSPLITIALIICTLSWYAFGSGVGSPIVSGGPSGGGASTVTAPATGAGADTCTGGGCAIGASGISTDGGFQLGGISAAPNTGMYQSAANTVSVAVSGGLVAKIDANGITVPNGEVVSWSLADSSSYIYRVTANTLRVGGSGTGSFIVSGNLTVDNTTVVTGALIASSSVNKGQITLSSGTGTATVTSGSICTCTDTGATPIVLRCNVATTTLTASEVSGTSTHVINYLCL